MTSRRAPGNGADPRALRAQPQETTAHEAREKVPRLYAFLLSLVTEFQSVCLRRINEVLDLVRKKSSLRDEARAGEWG